MSSNVTLLLARRSMRARIGRLIAIAIAIVLGVAFVVGSFVLADSMRSGFDSLFTDAFAEHRPAGAHRARVRRRQRRHAPATRSRPTLVDTVAAVPGVADADGMLQRSAQIIDADGEAVTTGGAPMFGASWDGTDPDSTIELRRRRRPERRRPGGHRQEHGRPERPRGRRPDRRRHDDRTRTRSRSPGTVGLGDSDGFGGATFALWDPATAAEVLGAEGVYDAIDIRVADGEDVAAVQQRIAEVLPDNIEVVDQRDADRRGERRASTSSSVRSAPAC